MRLPRLLHRETLTVLVVTTGEPDDDGVPTEDVVERAVPGWNVQPVGTNESLGDAEVVTGRWRASGPLTEWLQAGDRLRWRGTAYRVDGEPQHYRGGSLDHTEVVLIAWKGA